MNTTDTTTTGDAETPTLAAAIDEAYERQVKWEKRLERQREATAAIAIKKRIRKALGPKGPRRPSLDVPEPENWETQIYPDASGSDVAFVAKGDYVIDAGLDEPVTIRGYAEMRANSRWAIALFLRERCDECRSLGIRAVPITGLASLGRALDGEGQALCPKHYKQLRREQPEPTWVAV